MNSFVTFLKGSGDPDDPPALLAEEELLEELDIKSEIKEELDPPDEEITPTDHTPASPQITDRENTSSSETTTHSECVLTSTRENLRRSQRVKRCRRFDTESDSLQNSKADLSLTDKTSAASDEEEEHPRRGKGRGVFSPLGRGRGIKQPAEKENTASTSKSSSPNTTKGRGRPPSHQANNTPKRRGRPPSHQANNTPKKRGRPPSHQANIMQPTTARSEGSSGSASTQDSKTQNVSLISERKGPSQLGSACNYAGGRAQHQQNQTMLPEGPQVAAEQPKMVKSQFKSGDFCMAKKDVDVMENPPIYRYDGKSLLQKFQAFEKDGKILHRNVSVFSGWTSKAKAQYVGVNVTYVFQSRNDTVVQMVGFKPQEEEEEDGDSSKDDSQKESSSAVKTVCDYEIPEELQSHMKNFEIYLQTLISHALDKNFLQEIFEEKDSYFVDSMKVFDDLAEERKEKILEMIQWDDNFKKSLDTWPCVNVMLRKGKNSETCKACSNYPCVKLLQLFGQPYSQQTLHSREPLPSESEVKNYEVCNICSNISQLYSKLCHLKYDYYSECKSKVTNMRVANPRKVNVAILQDLLVNDDWITKLFCSMCTILIKVDKQHQDKMQKKGEQPTAT